METYFGNMPTGVAAPSQRSRKATAGTVKGLVGRKPRGEPLQLSSLSQRHLDILSLHLSGDFTGSEIAQVLGCSTSKVYQVLEDPLCKNVIEQFRRGQLSDLEALLPKAVAGIREGLDAKDVRTKLLAVDRFMKMSKHGFEDQTGNTNVSVTIVDARTRFVNQLKDLVDITPLSETPDGRTPSTAAKAFVEADYSEVAAE